MKNLLSFILFGLLLLLGSACTQEVYEMAHANADFPPGVERNEQHPLYDSIQQVVDKYLELGIPGVQLMLKDRQGYTWTAGGYANIATQTPMTIGRVSWWFSITKMVTATLVLRAQEQGKIDLAKPLATYLPATILSGIPQTDQITVSMLLSHSSGIVNVTELPAFQLEQLNHPLRQPSVQERLAFVANKPLLFPPGTDFSYSNTNFLLLQLLLEEIYNQPFALLVKEEILEPLGLTQAFIGLTMEQMEALPFPHYYFDRFANDQLEDVSAWNAALGNTSGGYGGVAGTPIAAIRFMQALVTGKLLQPSSWAQMQTWVQGKESTIPDYGLGLEYYQYGTGGHQFGHEGDGIGCTTMMIYFPDQQAYLYINLTVGRQLYGPYLIKSVDMKNELCALIARH